MNAEAVKNIVMEVVRKETEALREELAIVKTEQKKNCEVIEKLKTENKKLWEEIGRVDRNLDEVEQYNRRSTLILGGAFPEGEEGETPAQTREIAKKVIKDNLKVDMKGEIVACHRLRNKKRVIVKFLDHDDREAVYQAKFEQGGQPGEKITVHENLTDRRAKMIVMLENMRKQKEVLNYYTRNGNIMARDSFEKRYSRVQPWFTEQEVKATLQKAALKTNQQQSHNNLMQS